MKSSRSDSKKTRSRSRSEQRRRQRRRRIISLVILATIVLSCPLWSDFAAQELSRRLIEWNDHFRVNHVTVVGTKILTEEAIISLAKIPLRQSMFDLPFRDIEKRIEKNSWVRSARVRRRLPDTVVLEINERTPLAAVRAGQLMVLTSDSMAISPPSDNWVWDLPILSPSKATRFESGMKIKESSVLSLLEQAACARRVSPGMWANISELFYIHGQIHAILNQPPVEVITAPEFCELSWIGLQRYLAQVDPDSVQNHTTVDLRMPGKLVVSHENKETMENTAG
jgi:hypothetical protein